MEPLNGLRAAMGLTEQFRISVDWALRDFCNKQDVEEYIFPSGLNSEQRKFIHEKCRAMRLISKSQGKEPNRKLHIRKSNALYSKVFLLQKKSTTMFHIDRSLANYRESLSQNGINNQKKYDNSPQNDQVFNRLSAGFRVTVSEPISNGLMKFRKNLPVSTMRDAFLHSLDLYQVIIVISETGSGKTTQIPQFILEDVCASRRTCKVICTQPRRISTVAVAERVSAERGEAVGSTVGYQIKLKYQCSPKSSLIYCTNGVLLRTLMNYNEDYLENITHIIVDEIHERDKYTDFLLISLKQCLLYHPHLKVILMSATADIDLFMGYFENAQLLNIPGKLFPVKEHYLEDILLQLNYGNYANKISGHDGDLAMGTSNIGVYQIESTDEILTEDDHQEIEMMNNMILNCMTLGEENSFHQLLHLILSENVNVNHQTPVEGFTALMAAAVHGNLSVAEQLLNLGADSSLKCKAKSLNATEWAHFYGKNEVCEFLQWYDVQNINHAQQSQYEENVRTVLDNYDRTISDEAIDFALIVKIIAYIHSNDNIGTILIFLPGYEDIISCQENILLSPLLNVKEFEILMLHGSMNINAQHCVFDVVPNKQKIVLSTNIAETSITIADVVYVIDTGRAKEKSYDSISGTCALQKIWISKASVKQRAGRAGRTQPGVCFHIFSKQRHESMPNNRVPEILRVPLHELCLQTKLLAPKHLKIADYLRLALEPPPSQSVDVAIQSLKILGALNENEDLTPLGQHLVQFSVEPRLGKMLIYGIIFKCLDPILTIVACLAYKEPFMLPQQPKMKQLALQKQKDLAGDSLSDHLTLLRAFQFWQEVKVTNKDKDLVENNFISWSAMEIIHATRSQLLSQLRGAGFVSLQKFCTIQELNTNSNCWPVVKAALTAGCYPNIAFSQTGHFATRTEKKIVFHKSSSLQNFNCDKKGLAGHDYCVIYEELSKVGKHCSVKCGTVITPFTVALICGDKIEQFSNNLIIDDWLDFQHEYTNLAVFRETAKSIIASKIANPQYVPNSVEQDVLNTIMKILCAEEQRYELPQPAGVGLTPKLFVNVKAKNSEQQMFDLNSHQGRPRDTRRHFSNRANRYQNTSVNGLSQQFSNGLNIGRTSRPNDRSNWQVNNNNAGGYSTSREQTNHFCKGVSSTYMPDTPLRHNRNKPGEPPSCLRDPTEFYNCNGESSGDVLMRAISAAKFTAQSGLQNNRDILPLECMDIPLNTAFFVIKPPDYNNLQMGIAQGSWIFSPQSERKIFKFFNQGFHIVLFFSIAKAQEFQGVAKLLATNGGDVNSSCPIKWLSTTILPYRRIRMKNLRNPYAQHALVFQCNDGQEVEYTAGRQLYNLFFEPVPEDELTLCRRPILGSFKSN